MEKLITILYLSLLCVGLNAQQYKPVLDGEIVRWSFLDQLLCSNVYVVESTDIVAYGNVSFNDVIYKKLYLDNSFDSANDVEESNANWQNHIPQLYYEWKDFFIRESEDNSKLYVYNSYWDEEYLISDMNLQEGETFQLSTDGGGTLEAIVDSVYFKNGLKHIRWIATYERPYFHGPFTFIESIGSNKWLVYPDGCNSDASIGLNCFQNKETFYKNEETLNYLDFADFPCGIFYQSAGINSILNNNYNIFIQKDKIEILFTFDVNVDVSIYDLNGILYYEQNTYSQNIVIPTTELPKGIYILSVFDKNTNKQYTSKIIL